MARPTTPICPKTPKGTLSYTGTHDNPTTLGWWNSLDGDSRARIATRVNGEITAPAWHLLDMAFATTAGLVVALLQDLMHLDDRARFNTQARAKATGAGGSGALIRIWRMPSAVMEQGERSGAARRQEQAAR